MKNKSTLPKKLYVFVILFIANVFTITAADFEVDNISYKITGDNEVEVTKRDSVLYTGEVIIPATVEHDGVTYQVTRVGNSAFGGCKSLTLVGIPEGVTSFGTSAFSGCSNLENIDLPNSLVSIDRSAFWGCTSFTQFHVPRNLAEIAYNAFMECYNISYYTCSSLNPHFKAVDGVLYTKDMTMLYEYPPGATATTFNIPSTVTSLHDYCFSYNRNLTEMVIPETVTWMGMNIFRGCSELRSVVVPDGVTHMGVTVFGNCTKLVNVNIPASLDSLMSSTFMECNSLVELTVPRNVSYCDQMSFAYAHSLKNIHFEEGSRLKTIGLQAFRECTSLEYVDLPESVETIGNACFYECSSLKWVHVGKNLTEIGNGAFGYCDSLQECVILGSPATVKNLTLHCHQLKRLVIGSKDSTPGTTLLQSSTTFQTDSIEYLEFGANIDSLEHYAFSGLRHLKIFICWAKTPPRCNGFSSTFGLPAESALFPLYVPRESVEAYRNAEVWRDFPNIIAIEDVGDVNRNNRIDVGDVAKLINMLLTGEIERAYADINLDGAVTVGDVAALINKLLSGQ